MEPPLGFHPRCLQTKLTFLIFYLVNSFYLPRCLQTKLRFSICFHRCLAASKIKPDAKRFLRRQAAANRSRSASAGILPVSPPYICPDAWGRGALESGPLRGPRKAPGGRSGARSPPRRPTDRGTREGRARAGPSWGDPPRRGAEGPRRARRGAEGGPPGPPGAAQGRAPGPSAPAGPEPGRSPARRRRGEIGRAHV